MARLPFRSELVGAEIVWLLEVVYAGRTFYLSERSITVLMDDGTALPFDGSLQAVEWEESFDLISESPAERSVSVEFVFPGGFDVAQHVTWGHDLRAATATLSLLVVGQTYENRRVVLSGYLREPEYETASDPVSCSIDDNPWLDTSLLLDGEAWVTDLSWPDHSDLSTDQPYPIVFGRPGNSDDAGSSYVPATPVHFVDTTFPWRLLLAGHRVRATTVSIFTVDGARNVWAVSHAEDLFGRTCAIVDGYALPVGVTSEDELWAGWTHVSRGGMVGLDGVSEVTKASDVLRVLLARTSLPVDQGRWAAAARFLDSYQLHGGIWEQSSAWDWLVENVLPLLPVSVLAGESGLFPIVWRKDYTAADAVEHLVAGASFERDGAVTYESFEPVNEIMLSYAQRGDDGEHQRHRTLVGSAPDAADTTQIANLYSRLSRRRYGAGRDERESSVVWTATTADAVLGWLSRAYGFPVRVVTYSAALEYAWLQLGDIVTITDSEIAFAEQVALVRGLSWQGQALSVELMLIDDPARNVRTT